ncbi:MAG: hypothetical protein H7Y88_02235, partial [Phycisphaerales bacterium]|nr:hypothetical protein [Phycisphaerales bacterium]
MRLYVNGVGNLVEGKYAEASADLESASRLDPGEAAVWRAYGEAQLRSGMVRNACAAYQRAAGVGDAGTLGSLTLARAAVESGDHGAAARWVWPLLADERERGDAGAMHAADVVAAQAMWGLGYMKAGVELNERGLNLPDRFGQPTSFRDELLEVYRRRGDLWRATGEAAIGLGDFGGAERAFTQAARFPTPDPGAALPRRILALMMQGRSAEAARAIVADAGRSDRRLEDRHLVLTGFVARDSDERVGQALREALEAEWRGRAGTATPTERGAWARAIA